MRDYYHWLGKDGGGVSAPSSSMVPVAYIISHARDSEATLCAFDGSGFFQMPLRDTNVARLAAECSAHINSKLGGVNYGRALAEVLKA